MYVGDQAALREHLKTRTIPALDEPSAFAESPRELQDRLVAGFGADLDQARSGAGAPDGGPRSDLL